MSAPRLKHILMTADTVGGVWTYALELARALADHDIHVSLATMGAMLTTLQRREAESVGNVDLYETRYRLEWMPEPWDDIARAGEWLLGLEERVRPDVVHLNSYAPGALPWRAPALLVGHSCVLSWWQAVHGCPAPENWNTYRQVVTAGIQKADMVAAPSRAMLQALKHYYGPLREARVLPNGRELRPAMPRSKEPLIFSAGRLWDPAKNLSALTALAPSVEWPIYVAGPISEPGTAAAPAEPLTTAGPVRHLGILSSEQMSDWFVRASIYALPARYEPFGLSILEAALAGCALVLGDIPSLREIWGEAAWFVPPDDPEALRQALQMLIGDPVELAKYSARAEAMSGLYSRHMMAQGYLAAYADLLQARTPGQGKPALTEKNEPSREPAPSRSEVCVS